ncbi:MAG TPA: hypothetical protein VGC77_14435 [Rhodopseudomonas sp.]|uniref:hypothetical protein n=1 Tax=Rhodopseudomonas sp. TaxID=1078 RepID=UPI002EDB9BB6
MTRHADPRRGAALIVVLVFTSLIAGLAVVTTRSSLSSAAAGAVFLDEMRADRLGRDAADVVAYQLQSEDPQARRGGSFAVHLPSSDIAVDYVSEMARIDVNAAPPKLLANLFIAAEVEPDLAAEIAGRIERLRGRSRAPNAAQPNASSAPAAGAQAEAGPALLRTEQIIDAWGVPDSLYRAIQPALTVASKSSKVDPTLAGRLVVTALMEGDEDKADDFIDRRSRGFLSAEEALTQLPAATRGFAGFGAPQAVRAVAHVTLARRFRRDYEIVMAVANGQDKAARILSWQPLFP